MHLLFICNSEFKHMLVYTLFSTGLCRRPIKNESCFLLTILAGGRKVIMYCQLLPGINSFHKDVAYARGSNFFILIKLVLFSKSKEHKVPLSHDNTINSSPQ